MTLQKMEKYREKNNHLIGTYRAMAKFPGFNSVFGTVLSLKKTPSSKNNNNLLNVQTSISLRYNYIFSFEKKNRREN